MLAGEALLEGGKKMRRILIARIGWMKFYTGPQPGDEKPIGGGKYTKKHIGGEAKNFKVWKRQVFGAFANVMNASELNLTRIDPNATGDSLHNVLLIFFARDPRPHSRGQVLIGWHKNATITSEWSASPWGHWSVASAKSAVLLPTHRRTCSIPRGRNTPGQANVFYLFNSIGEYRNRKWVDDVLTFIDSYSGPNLVSNPEAEAYSEVEAAVEKELATAFAQGVQSDPAARRAIENAAMNAAQRYFKGIGFKPLNVSSSRSYDLHCLKNGKELFVEVKGSQAPVSKILLTPNEVSFAKKNSRKMVLFILHSIKLSHRRKLFRASGGVPKIISPWRIRLNQLTPVQYFYNIKN